MQEVEFPRIPILSDHETSQVFSVSEVTSQVKSILEASFPSLWVEGEISNFMHHTSGHMYFTLKDDRSELRVVMFRRDNRFLRFAVENGMKILAFGNITVYEARGVYQLVAKRMEPSGLGTLYLAFEALKKKLAQEGLFDDSRKRPVPRYPTTVGVITSGTGAAIQDITNVLGRRAPHIGVILRPTVVQGHTAAGEIEQAIHDFEEFGVVDVIIVGRGGGSLEDLWAFNEEKVARAIALCSIPTISAVGHESDFTIADFVADLRAPTPSAAAELVSPSRDDLLLFLQERERRCRDALLASIEMAWQRIDFITARYGFQHPKVLMETKRQKVQDNLEKLIHRMHFILSLQRAQFHGLTKRLVASNPRGILKRGYSIAYEISTGMIINRVDLLNVGEEFGLMLSDGEAVAQTKQLKKGDEED